MYKGDLKSIRSRIVFEIMSNSEDHVFLLAFAVDCVCLISIVSVQQGH